MLTTTMTDYTPLAISNSASMLFPTSPSFASNTQSITSLSTPGKICKSVPAPQSQLVHEPGQSQPACPQCPNSASAFSTPTRVPAQVRDSADEDEAETVAAAAKGLSP